MEKSAIRNIRFSLVSKLILGVGLTLFLCISVWAYYNIKYQKNKLIEHILEETARLGTTIKLGTHYAMMHNSRDDINQIINNVARQKGIENIRIYNKHGQIKFSNRVSEVDKITNIKAEACDVCHRFDPPIYKVSYKEMTRFFKGENNKTSIGIITPILNEPGCSSGCHVHPKDKKVLGALDVVLSMEKTNTEIKKYEKGIIKLAIIMFITASAIIFIIMLKFVNQPIKKLIEEAEHISKGDYSVKVDIKTNDEMGQLADAINHMNSEIKRSQAELSKQKNEYKNLFELVPCNISILDRNFRLISYNKRFEKRFKPVKGDYCYHSYKGRDEKCENCPVAKTFIDGQPHYSEETCYNKEGDIVCWLVVTSPVKNAEGEIIGAMEMCLDMTNLKRLEDKLEKTEQRYRAIFNNIPNPVFVLDTDELIILDCNKSVKNVYGYEKHEIINKSFMSLFKKPEETKYASMIKSDSELNQVRHVAKNGKILFVNIRISPYEYMERKVFLVTTSDITKRLEVEQQLIQASKMATLGEMATGVAHELNQPLSVIKTASSFFMKKIRKKEPIKDEILLTMVTEIDKHIRRATKIINHMREFGRKSDMGLEPVFVNTVLEKAFEIFSQQLKLRGIDVVWELYENLPPIEADPSRLEQVFINLLINARDAIEDKWAGPPEENYEAGNKKIFLRTKYENNKVIVEVEDTGIGIPDEIREKIFEPFFTTKEVGKGTGLGLSISYGIIKDCKGSIRAVSSVGKGTCFIIEFPAFIT